MLGAGVPFIQVRGRREELKRENDALKEQLAELKRVQADRSDRDAKLVLP